MDNALLDKLVPLAGLRPEVRNNVLSQSLIREIPPGNYIFRVGEPATHSFYLLEGELAFEDANGKLLTSIKSSDPAALYQLAHQSRFGAQGVKSAPDAKIAVDHCIIFAECLSKEAAASRP